MIGHLLSLEQLQEANSDENLQELLLGGRGGGFNESQLLACLV